MKQNNFNKIGLLVFILILLIVFIFINGISMITPSKIFSTKYYDSSEKAYNVEYEHNPFNSYNNEIKEKIYDFEIDLNNSLLIAINEENDLLVAQMYKKKGKYLFIGNYYSLDEEKLAQNNISEQNTRIYDKSGNYYKDVSVNISLLSSNNNGYTEINNELIEFTINDINYKLFINLN